MRAARIHAFCGPVSIDDVPESSPAAGEEIVDVLAAAANPLDLWVTEGNVAGGSQPLPFTLGTEGVVSLNGRRLIASGYGIGSTRDGLLRERATVPSDALTPVPDGVADAEAACASVVGVTAKRIIELSGLAVGEVLIVLGASGGVGSVAVQLGKAAGATVVAVTSSPDKHAFVQDLGADHVFVAELDQVGAQLQEHVGPAADVVLDPLGGSSIAVGSDLLRAGGRQVLFGRSQSDSIAFGASAFYRKSLTLLGYGGLSDPPDRRAAALTSILDDIAAGRVRIPIGHELELGDAAQAYELLRAGEARGKIVMRVAQS